MGVVFVARLNEMRSWLQFLRLLEFGLARSAGANRETGWCRCPNQNFPGRLCDVPWSEFSGTDCAGGQDARDLSWLPRVCHYADQGGRGGRVARVSSCEIPLRS